MGKKIVLKDDKLNEIVEKKMGNIAQFISFEPISIGKVKYVHINKYKHTEESEVSSLIEKLIEASSYKAVNIRSFSKEILKGNRFVYNKRIEDMDEIIRIINENSLDGKYSIINENIDINDGGVSGVLLGDMIEFSPNDTPKCVDKEGVCSLPRDIGMKILEKVYGYKPDINFDKSYRVEFSIHPKRQGLEKEHTIIWEYEHFENAISSKAIIWPNNFSKFIGDKTFGLLIADILGLRVPKTTVISRNVAPFIFGKETGLNEVWIRTCPVKKEPGKYFTGDKWIDPFILMKEEELKGDKELNIASILSQSAVESIYSGGSIIKKNREDDIIEGVFGKGDSFMVGNESVEKIPQNIVSKIKKLNNKIRSYYNELGEVSIEWVYDGKEVWVVQLNQVKVKSSKDIIVEGSPDEYIKFDVSKGLEELRKLIKEIERENKGIELIGNIGITSHFGDLLRLACIPSRLIRNI